MKLPERVRIVEVGPRDGLQNEPETISTSTKARFVEKLVAAGLQHIELTSFVHPKAIPQLSDALNLVRLLPAIPDVSFSALVPNLKGLQRAHDAGIKRIAVFTAATESFSQKNIRMTIDESMTTFSEVIRQAGQAGMTVRAYLSTCFVCPYEGEVSKETVQDLALRLLDLGADEIAISDTIGAATPSDVFETVQFVLQRVPRESIALHFHDTYGTALANVLAGLQLGITTYDSSAGGLGGCPYAPGASGNLATEDLVYMLERMGIETRVDLAKLAEASHVISRTLGRDLPSKQLQRLDAAGE